MPRNRPPRTAAPPARESPAATQAAEGGRIAKVMARAGLCSRREAESWIAAGRVSVNGATIASPALNVGPRDLIAVDGMALPARERTRLFLYNKPRGLVTTHADPQGRATIFSALPAGMPRLISVGRLDINTEGLLLLTNDGGLARILELPQTGWLRRYRVRAHGSVIQPQLDALRRGITIDGIRYGEIEATVDRAQGANVWITFAIREGKNREVRKVLEHLGLQVNRLIRVSYGPFQLGELGEGAVEEIRTRHLREQLGPRIAEAAGADFSGPMVALPDTDDAEARRPPAAVAQRPSKSDGKPERPSDQHRHPPKRAARAPQDDGRRKEKSRKSAQRWNEARGTEKRGAEKREKRPDPRRHPEARGRPDGSATRFARGGREENEDRRETKNRKQAFGKRRQPEARDRASEGVSKDDRSARRPRRHGPFRTPSGGKGKRK